MSKVNPKEYALYKGDKLLAIGTCRAIEMGIKESTVYSIVCQLIRKEQVSVLIIEGH